MVGLITDNDKTADREEVRDLTMLCKDNNLSLNVSKTKDLTVDYRKLRGEHVPIHIDGAVEERVESLKFHITKELTWSTHTHTVVKRVQQHLLPLRNLKRFGVTSVK